jgi:taurine dioxygenase
VLRELLAEHGVLLFADQSLDDDAFVAFLRSFGELTFTKGETHVDGHPDLNVVSNAGRATPPKSAFHIDKGRLADGDARTLGEVLAQQPVGVLVAAALPRAARITEAHLHAAVDAEPCVLGHLVTLIARQRPAQLLGQRRDRLRQRATHRVSGLMFSNAESAGADPQGGPVAGL